MDHLLTRNLFDFGDIIILCVSIVFNKSKFNTSIMSDLNEVIKILNKC